MTLQTHRCAADGCHSEISKSLLMCLHHWRMVPVPLKKSVLVTYRAYIAVGAVDYSPLNKRRDYLKAVKQAVAAVREKEIKRQARNNAAGDVLDFN